MPCAYPLQVSCSDFVDLVGCAVMALAAGAAQASGKTRMQLWLRNEALFQGIVPKIAAHASRAILLIASNPLDVMTHIATKLSGFPPARVLDTGTMLETAWFRSLLATYYGIVPSSVHAYVLRDMVISRF